MFRWYVVNTYSGHENKVKHNLEHRVVSLEQAHAASLRTAGGRPLSDRCANREVGALEADVEHVRDPA